MILLLPRNTNTTLHLFQTSSSFSRPMVPKTRPTTIGGIEFQLFILPAAGAATSTPPLPQESQYSSVREAVSFNLLSIILQVNIAYIPFVERAEIFLPAAWNYDIAAGRLQLAGWIQEMNKMDGLGILQEAKYHADAEACRHEPKRCLRRYVETFKGVENHLSEEYCDSCGRGGVEVAAPAAGSEERWATREDEQLEFYAANSC
ncbi:Glutathione S-transferase L1, partial [Linum grandiflorum]